MRLTENEYPFFTEFDYRYQKEMFFFDTSALEREQEKQVRRNRKASQKRFVDQIKGYFAEHKYTVKVSVSAIRLMFDHSLSVEKAIVSVYRKNGYRTLAEWLKDRRISLSTKLDIGRDLIDRLAKQ